MSKSVTIGNATLHFGNCLEVLPSLPPADAVITDPPYDDRTHRMAKTNKGKGHGTKLVTFDALTGDEFEVAMRACLAASRGWVVATCDYRHAALAFNWKEFIRLGAWVKPNPMPQISADRPGQGFESVLILHSGLTKKAWNRGGGSGVWTVPSIDAASVPTEKPIALAKAFVSDFTLPGQTVLDPFMGSGTTGAAALGAGRLFVGIEQNEIRFHIACQRLELAQRQQRLFA
jgi:site-specific DNA-methyltransferase (adenine-specific)